jgi:hypothetical protein
MAGRIPLKDWDEFVRHLESEHDRNLEPMDFIRALYFHISYMSDDVDYIATKLPDSRNPVRITAEELAERHGYILIEDTAKEGN